MYNLTRALQLGCQLLHSWEPGLCLRELCCTESSVEGQSIMTGGRGGTEKGGHMGGFEEGELVDSLVLAVRETWV